MKTKPDLGFWKLWNLSFGFFGVQIAYALQSSQVSRIFSTIGADPHDLSFFWILPPLMGFLVQPIIGSASDRTWNRFGRRLPYLILGAAIAIVVMCFLPNAGSLEFGKTPTWFFGLSSAVIFGLIMLMLLDTSINMAMQPFKMLVGDMVNEKQKGLAYSIQSFLCNAGSLVGYLAPLILALFLSNQAPEGEVPPTVIVAFYLGAAILLFCVFYTFAKVKEMPPHVYAEYNGVPDDSQKQQGNMFKQMAGALKTAPKVFWTIGVVQFFCWACFLYMWSYSTETVAIRAFDCPVRSEIQSVTINGNTYGGKFLLVDGKKAIDNGQLTIAAVNIDGTDYVDINTIVNAQGDTIVKGGQIFYNNGVPAVEAGAAFAKAGDKLDVDGNSLTVADAASTVSTLSTITPANKLEIAEHVTDGDNGNYIAVQGETLPAVAGADIALNTNTVLNYQSKQYQDAGDWNGFLFAVQAIIAVIWAAVLPRFRNRRFAYSFSLLIGAIGFISTMFLTGKVTLCISYGLMGCGWAAMLAMPFTILTNALSGKNIGTYLGLFNCTICLPQIVASVLGGAILGLLGTGANGAPNTPMMLVIGGVLMLIGSLCVWVIKETSGQADAQAREAAQQAKLNALEDA